MRKIILVLFAFLLPLFLVGSGEAFAQEQEKQTTGSIKIQTLVYADGSVSQGFFFSLNSSLLKELGASESGIVLFSSSYSTKINHLRNLLVASFYSIYMQNPDEQFAIGDGGGLEFGAVKLYDEQTIGFQMLFTSSEAWQYYHPSSNQGDKEEGEESGENIEFITTKTSSGEIIFSQNLSSTNQTVGEYLTNLYLDSCEQISINAQDIYYPLLVYEYGVSSSKIHSNADSIFYSELGLYHHVWQRTLDNYQSENQISIYIKQVNKQWWYLTIICVGVGTVAIGFAGAAIYNKFKNKKQNSFIDKKNSNH